MRFANNYYLFLLWSIPVFIVAYIVFVRHSSRLISRIGDAEVVKKMYANKSRQKTTIKYVLRIAVLGLLILAIARPQYGFKMQPVTRKGLDVVVAVDTSKSMLTEDIKPNRLIKAKHEIKSFVNKLRGDRIGIIAFSGNAFIQCPLTIDYEAASLFVNNIDTDTVPEPGTNISKAIETSLLVFGNKERKYKVILLITDGEDLDNNALAAAKKAAREGVIIFTVGIGSVQGEPIPQLDNDGVKVGYKKDRNGTIIVSRLNEKLLKDIALTTEGGYYHASPAEFELDTIYKEIRSMDQKEIRSKLAEQYEDRYQYPLFLAFMLLLLELLISERKRERT
ncbi:MAG: hypothetical protein DKM50_02170 [Candidatus Margulisiibacteriota bacterium]|nr:MAG: hypothetical protein A2X43_06630 [Candidatus Margulisbacteria bacterium GWD2_39_127]OGI05305.1 MAG: hypothetical protein A2X42_03855 [Candidatus Margulisbacteria bacterium GWF2_38_17]OGI10836.1 MAG: hypothetical protein A2X41_05620 [Candidatus Margulisbacteria bacterium GWE2_39_32]PZM83522.1 MAG: hypothetical protein DKM50_02170 [Candidatus Margulisiibacteriota bacterium]HAR64301.1 hypothetical protein [Candidatus Margulisiibacteriota bacterium]